MQFEDLAREILVQPLVAVDAGDRVRRPSTGHCRDRTASPDGFRPPAAGRRSGRARAGGSPRAHRRRPSRRPCRRKCRNGSTRTRPAARQNRCRRVAAASKRALASFWMICCGNGGWFGLGGCGGGPAWRCRQRLAIAGAPSGLGLLLGALRELLLGLLLGAKVGHLARRFGARGQGRDSRSGMPGRSRSASRRRAGRPQWRRSNRRAGAEAEPVQGQRCCFFSAGGHGNPPRCRPSAPDHNVLLWRKLLRKRETALNLRLFITARSFRIASRCAEPPCGAACGARKYLVRTIPPGAFMAVIIDTVRRSGRPRHPEKAHRPDQPACASRTGSGSRRRSRRAIATRDDRARQRPAYGVRGGRLPQYRRVLGEEARHLHDHGRHLHARLRVLQRQDRAARRARCRGAGACRRSDREARPRPCRHHLGRPRRSRRRRRGAFRRRHPRDPRALPATPRSKC